MSRSPLFAQVVPALGPKTQEEILSCGPSYARVSTMDSMRMASPGSVALWKPCCRCGDVALGWDRIADKPYCPACQEAIVQGEGEPLVETTRRRPCTACHRMGSVTLQIFPLKSSQPLELDLCPEHLRGFLGRKLGEAAYAELRRGLAYLGIDVHDIFLLHEAFYDALGHALQPAADPE